MAFDRIIFLNSGYVRNVTSTKIIQLVLLTAALITFTWILFT
jgi:hypothetical protein